MNRSFRGSRSGAYSSRADEATLLGCQVQGKGARRRIMAMLRLSSMVIVFGRRAKVGPFVGARPARFSLAPAALASALLTPVLALGGAGLGLLWSPPAHADTSCFTTTSWSNITTDGVTMAADFCENDAGIIIESNSDGAGGTVNREGILLRTKGTGGVSDIASLFSGYYVNAASGVQIKIGDASMNPAGATNSVLRIYTDKLLIGSAATAVNGQDATAIGDSANANGNFTQALGSYSAATAVHATAIGSGPSAGLGATASAAGATAIGANATGGANAAATDSIAVGGQSSVTAAATSGIAIGKGAAASVGTNTIAIGQASVASNTSATAVGNLAAASNTYTTAIGSGLTAVTASAAGATAIGGNPWPSKAAMPAQRRYR